jgi:hypothetical protein
LETPETQAGSLKDFQFSVEGIEEWLDDAGIVPSMDRATSTAVLTYTPPPVVVRLVDGKRAKFDFTWKTSNKGTEARMMRQARRADAAHARQVHEQRKRFAIRSRHLETEHGATRAAAAGIRAHHDALADRERATRQSKRL